MINKKIFFDCELVKWPLICRDLYQRRWMGVADATSDRWKQTFSAVRASGGCPGNDIRRTINVNRQNFFYFILIYFRGDQFDQ